MQPGWQPKRRCTASGPVLLTCALLTGRSERDSILRRDLSPSCAACNFMLKHEACSSCRGNLQEQPCLTARADGAGVAEDDYQEASTPTSGQQRRTNRHNASQAGRRKKHHNPWCEHIYCLIATDTPSSVKAGAAGRVSEGRPFKWRVVHLCKEYAGAMVQYHGDALLYAHLCRRLHRICRRVNISSSQCKDSCRIALKCAWHGGGRHPCNSSLPRASAAKREVLQILSQQSQPAFCGAMTCTE